MSQDELVAISKAKNESEKMLSRKTWEQTRLICYYVVTAMQGTEIKTKDGQIIKLEKPEDLIPFGWDEPKEGKPKAERLTREEFLERANKIKELKHLG